MPPTKPKPKKKKNVEAKRPTTRSLALQRTGDNWPMQMMPPAVQQSSMPPYYGAMPPVPQMMMPQVITVTPPTQDLHPLPDPNEHTFKKGCKDCCIETMPCWCCFIVVIGVLVGLFFLLKSIACSLPLIGSLLCSSSSSSSGGLLGSIPIIGSSLHNSVGQIPGIGGLFR